jgi:CHAT domain-containing protein/tetratricopeptide (TPR) repeat protein
MNVNQAFGLPYIRKKKCSHLPIRTELALMRNRCSIRKILRSISFIVPVAFSISCQTTTDKDIFTTTLSDAQLDEMEVYFSRFPLPPPQRTINDVRNNVDAIDFSHISACNGAEFYEVTVPEKWKKLTENKGNSELYIPLTWRDASTNAFRYGDFEKALEYLDGAKNSISFSAGNIAYLASIIYSRSIYLAILGDVAESDANFSKAAAMSRSAPRYGIRDQRRYDAWYKEAAAVNAYAQGRYREAEIRLRDIRSGWTAGMSPMGFANTSTNQIPLSLETYAMTSEVFVNYLLVLSLAKQNRLVAAESEARSSMWRVEDPIDLAWIMDALAIVMLKQGRYEDAEWVLRRMADFFEGKCAPSHYFIVLRTYLRLAQTLTAQSKWEDALPYYDLAYTQQKKDASGLLDRLFLETPDWPIAQMLSGDLVSANENFDIVMTRVASEYGSESYRAKEIEAFEALNSAKSNPDHQTLRTLHNSVIALIETPDQTLGNVTDLGTHEKRLSLLIDEYLSLVGEQDLANDAARSFQIAQAGRHGSVQTALSSSALRARVPDPVLKSLLRKYQDILNRLEEIDRIYSALASFRKAGYQGPGVLELGIEIRTLEAARESALRRLRTEFPEFAQFTDNTPLKSDQTIELLQPGEAVIFLRATTDYIYVWAINHKGEISMAKTSLSSAELENLVDRLRRSVDPGQIETLGDIPRFNVEASYSLYQKILQPVRNVWGNAQSLIIVPDGALQQLPFSLLLTQAPPSIKPGALFFEEYRDLPWLARSHSVTVLPSRSSLAALRGFISASRWRAREFVGFGDPVFSMQQMSTLEKTESTATNLRSSLAASTQPLNLRAQPARQGFGSSTLSDLPPLPETRTELLSIAKSLGVDAGESIYLGLDANEQQVLGMDLSNVRILAFSTHGLVSGELDGQNQPALALSLPETVGDEVGDGLLTLNEIIGLKLNADLVILSACNTASGDGLGAEAVAGLGRAFFFAGAKSLLVSHWPVHSKATASLMSKIFENTADGSSVNLAEAVRRARVGLIDEGVFVSGDTAVFSYAHPIFWAPFTLIGDGGS